MLTSCRACQVMRHPTRNRVAWLAGPWLPGSRSRLTAWRVIMPDARRGTVLVTGVGRRRSIGTGLALGLADDGWDLVLNYWAPYDERVGYARGEHDTEDVAAECRRRGSRVEVAAG